MKIKVVVTEHDNWSGESSEEIIFDTKSYDGDADKTLEAAQVYASVINMKNTLPYVPDFYLTASVPTIVQSVRLK